MLVNKARASPDGETRACSAAYMAAEIASTAFSASFWMALAACFVMRYALLFFGSIIAPSAPTATPAPMVRKKPRTVICAPRYRIAVPDVLPVTVLPLAVPLWL